MEHEVTEDELASPLEQVEQRRRTHRALEHVVLFDLDHRQAPAVGVQLVPLMRELLSRSNSALRATLHSSRVTI